MKRNKFIFIPFLFLPFSSLSIISNENNSIYSSNEMLTWHNLDQDFYDLSRDLAGQRTLLIDSENERLVKRYEFNNQAYPLSFDWYKIYFDNNYANNEKLLSKPQNETWAANLMDRYHKIIFDKNTKLSESEQNLIRKDAFRYQSFDLLRPKGVNIEFLYSQDGSFGFWSHKILNAYKISNANFPIINVSNEQKIYDLLTSNVFLAPLVDYNSYYGSLSGKLFSSYRHLPDNTIKIYSEEPVFEKSANISNLIKQKLLANLVLNENETIDFENTTFQGNWKIVPKIKIYEYNNIKNSDEATIRPYLPNMKINWVDHFSTQGLMLQSRPRDDYANMVINFDVLAPNLKVTIKNANNQNLINATSNYEKAFNSAKNLLQNLNILDITSNNINQSSLADANNIVLLNEKINLLNQNLREFDFFVNYRIKDDNKIDLYLSNQTNTLIPKEYKIVSNYPINIKFSTEAVNNDIQERLVIKSNKWVDFETNTTALVDDIPVQLEAPRELSEKKVYGGKWLYHAPASVEFTTLNENEVLFINDKRIEVLNRKFKEILNDETSIYSSETKEQENKRREYKIRILKFRENSGNTETNLLYEYQMDLVISAVPLAIDYKFYAWNPSENPDQKKLITEYKEDKDGNILKDENDIPVKNEFYDPEIDVQTGTKKELVWVDLSNQTQLLSNDSYTRESSLPYGTKTLLLKNGNKLIKGFIAEASVLGSGALQMLNGEIKNSQYRVFKLDQDKLINNDYFGYSSFENGKAYKNLPLNHSENSYFSNSGLYLFTAHAKNSIDNYKIVLIDKNLNAQKTKFSTTINGINRIKNLWESPVGIEFLNYLQNKHNISNEIAKKLKYEVILQYFMLFSNYVYKVQEYSNSSNNIYISPYFNLVPHIYSYETFKNKFIYDLSGKDKFYDQFAGDFAYKDLVKINSLAISSDKRSLIINLGLKFGANNNIFAYRLSTSSLVVPISFIDVDYDEANTLNPNNPFIPSVNLSDINWNINNEKLANFFYNSRAEQWNNLTLDHEWLNGISLDDFNKVNWFVNVTDLSNSKYRVDIKGVIRDEFKRDFRLIPQKYSWEFSTNGLINTNSIDDEWSTIFTNNSINLAGLSDVEVIKEYIQNEIQKLFIKNRLTVAKDKYICENLEQVATLMTRISLSSDSPLPYKLLKIKRINNSKIYSTKVFNYVDVKYNQNFDLANLKFNTLYVNSNSLDEIKTQIQDHIQNELDKFNIKFSSIAIQNLDDVLRILMRGSEKAKLIIASNHYQIFNTASFNVINNYDFNNIETNTNLDERILVDLAKISILDLKLHDIHNFKALQKQIILHVSSFLANFNLYWNYDYYIENIDNPFVLQELIKNKENSLTLKVKALNKKATNETQLRIYNTLENDLSEKEIKDWNNKNDEKDAEIKKKIENFFDENDSVEIPLDDELALDDSENPNHETVINKHNVKDILERISRQKWDLIINRINRIYKDFTFVINKDDNAKLITNDDLSEILNQPLINLNEYKLADLHLMNDDSQSIFDAINSYLANNLTAPYQVYSSELNKAIKELLAKANSKNQTTLTIRAVYGASFGITKLFITNQTSQNIELDEINNDIKNKENIIQIQNKNTQIKAQNRKKNILKIALSTLFSFLAICGITGFVLYVRKFKKKLK